MRRVWPCYCSQGAAQVLLILVQKKWVPFSWGAGTKHPVFPRCKHLSCACTRWCKLRGAAPCAHSQDAPAWSNAEKPSRANQTPDYNSKLPSVLCRGAGRAAFLKTAISTYLEEDPPLFSMLSACGQSARAARAAAVWWGISWEGAAATNIAVGKDDSQDNVPRGQNQLFW